MAEPTQAQLDKRAARKEERRKSREAQLEKEVERLRVELEQERMRREVDQAINDARKPLDPESSRRIAGHIGKRLNSASHEAAQSTAQIRQGNESAERENTRESVENAPAQAPCSAEERHEGNENPTGNVVKLQTLSRVINGKDTPYEVKLEVTADICYAIVAGESLRDICRHEQFPNITTFLYWVAKDRDLSDMYVEALRMRAAGHAEKLEQDIKKLETEDDLVRVAALKAAIQTRQWIMSKLLPKFYGERVEHEHTHEHKHDVAQLDERLAALIANSKAGR